MNDARKETPETIDWTRTFRELGFEQPELHAERWRELRRGLGEGSKFLVRTGETVELLRGVADPQLAFATWTRWLEADLGDAERGRGERGKKAPKRSALWRDRRYREAFLTLAGVSPALGERLLAYWDRLRPNEWRIGWETPTSIAERLREAVAETTDSAFLDRVREFQQLETLRIAYLDCVFGVQVELVTLQISSLADAVIEECRRRAVVQVAQRRRKTPPERGFAVFAMGKLGGQELNYSSDIDLVFHWDETLERIEGEDGRDITDPLELEQFFRQVAERLVHLVTTFTGRGQLYRLDARLRPGGASGRLVWSVRAALDYYYSTGRAWERQALIRLRRVAGDRQVERRLKEELDPFVFSPNLSKHDIAEIRGLKQQMERLAADPDSAGTQIKTGRGGIRDVEYIVQFFQLLYGSQYPSLKTANLFKALETLDEEGFLQTEETDILRRGYRLLRRVENHVQLMHFLQTHELPRDPRELVRLARGLGFDSVGTLRAVLRATSDQIRRVYGLLFEEATAARPEETDLPALLVLPLETVEKEGAALLEPYGYADPRRAFRLLHRLAGAGDRRISLDAHRAQEYFVRLLRDLLREIGRYPQPDRTLANFESCVATLGARSVFYELLLEVDAALALFVQICWRTSFVVDTLKVRPDLFDEVVDAMLTGFRQDRAFLLGEAARLREECVERGVSFPEEALAFKQLQLVLTAIRDLQGQANLGTVLQQISDISEAILIGLLHSSLGEAGDRFGEWVGDSPRFVVLALGKLAGQEMNYRSDVDLVILYDGGGATAKGIGAQEYFERLSQIMLRQAATADISGPLLHVDLRLRPLGSHNSPAIALSAWRDYFTGGQAQTWERMAFLRTRLVAGDERLGEEVLRFVRGELVLGGSAGPPSRAAVLEDAWKMRQKLERHAGAGHLKRGRGGIVDVEFIVQVLQLCHGKEFPEVITSNTAEGLTKLFDASLLSAGEVSDLRTSYQFLRKVENRLALVSEAGQKLSSLDQVDENEVEALIQKLGYKASGEETALAIFRGELDYYRRVNRRLLRRVLERKRAGGETGTPG